jgi:hypothetical protein
LGQDISNGKPGSAANNAGSVAVSLYGTSVGQKMVNLATTSKTTVLSIEVVAIQTQTQTVVAVSATATQVTSQSLLGALGSKLLGVAGLATLGYDLLVATPAAAYGCSASRSNSK